MSQALPSLIFYLVKGRGEPAKPPKEGQKTGYLKCGHCRVKFERKIVAARAAAFTSWMTRFQITFSKEVSREREVRMNPLEPL